jgi:ABC-2 type transport system permease protein
MIGKMNIIVDLSSDRKYSLTEDSKNIVRNLKDNVAVYFMVQDGNDEQGIKDIMDKVLDQYASIGSKIKVETRDYVKLPNFATQYTDETITDYDVIVVNETNNKAKHVPIANMLPTEMDYNTMTQTQNTLDVEGQITAAIQSITSAEAKTIYVTKGHGNNEGILSASMTDLLTKSNYLIESTRTDGNAGIPDDCDILLMTGMSSDLNELDVPKILEYLENGGKAMIFLNPGMEESNMPNLNQLLNQYGIKINPGYVYETGDRYLNDPSFITGMVNSHDITSEITADTITPFIRSKGLTITSEVRSTLTAEPVYSSSDESFSNAEINPIGGEEKEAGDIDGPFTLVAAVTDEFKDKKTQLIVYGTDQFANTFIEGAEIDFVKEETFGNRSIIQKSVEWLSGQDSSLLVIPSRSLTSPTVDVPSDSRNMISALLIGVLPISILGFGFFIWYRRRKS